MEKGLVDDKTYLGVMPGWPLVWKSW